MTDVFISYSHKDGDYAHRLADELKRHKIDVWIDDRIDYGDQWPRTIQENLTACRTFLVIMSTNVFNSMWVQNEVSYAQANHKTIFPLLLEGSVWLSMSAMQYVDVSDAKMPPVRFFEKVENSLNDHHPKPIIRDGALGGRSIPPKLKMRPFFIVLILMTVVGAGLWTKWGSGNPRPPEESLTEPPITEPSLIPYGGGIGKISFISERDGNWEGYWMNSDGTDQNNFTNNPAIDGGISFSPDGKKVVFNSSRGDNTDIYVVNADDSDLRRLTDHLEIDNGPHWSPDGTRIAFSSNRDGNWEIYVMNADGSEQTRLTESSADDFVSDWSTDGKWLALFSTRDGNWDIFLMRIEDSYLLQLTTDSADDGVASFSPDGKQIVFHSNRDGNWEIYLVNVDGSRLSRLTNDPGSDENPSWSPDGKWIAFNSDRDGDSEIYILNIVTSELVKLTDNSAPDHSPQW